MVKRAQQIFVRTTDTTVLKRLLIEYVETHANEFNQCSTVRLEGVEQVLSSLVRKKREFRLFASVDWTTIWEIVEHTDFADPSIAKFLSKKAKTESVWLKLDDDYNIWAFQVYQKGSVVSEAFLPKSYFAGNPESAERFDYGSCNQLADEFNSSRDLPLFLDSLTSVERNQDLANSLEKVICKLPSVTR